MIVLKDVNKRYGAEGTGQQALKGISLEVSDGDFVCVLGASGSGKTTLLNVMSGLDKADSGHICYGDMDIAALSDRERTLFRRRHIGFVFQRYCLLPALTVDKNVRMGANLAKNASYREIIEAVGLGDKLHRYPRELSGGEQQRVAIARALAKKPEYLFLDEPTGALDEKSGRQILDYILKLRSGECFTAVIVTHNANIAETADVVVEMNSGGIKRVARNERTKGAYEIGW